MKIATIYTLYGRRAGAELCFEKTVQSINKEDANIEWIIFCNKQAYNLILEIFPKVNAIYIPNLDNQYKKAFWLEFLSNKVIRQYKPDCFWIPSGCNHFPGRWDIPVLTTFHDLGEYHIAKKYSIARMVFRKKICIPRSVNRSTTFTTVSQFTKNDMLRFLRIRDEKKIRVVYNGHSPHKMEVPLSSELLIKKERIEAQKYFFTPGRTDFIGKGLDILIDAFTKIAHEYPELKLVLVGPQGEGHELLIQHIENSTFLKDKLIYLGRVSDDMLMSLYHNCLATVIASRFEGFGFPVLEAMENMVPIVCSDAGSLPEIVGNAAEIFKSGDVKGLYNAMKIIINSPIEYREELISKGQKRINLYTWNNCAKQMLEEFKKIQKTE